MLKINFYVKCFLIVVPKFINKLFLKKNIKNELVLSTRYPKELIYFLKENSMIDASCLVDICVIDNLNLIQRFEINYNLLSVKHNFRYFIKTYTNLQMWSLTYLYESANWLEREVWDMFGIFFLNHPDLRRILTDYGFEGFPLRKDFPLTGYVELRYDDEKSIIVYEPLELAQEYRLFRFTSPWEKIK